MTARVTEQELFHPVLRSMAYGAATVLSSAPLGMCVVYSTASVASNFLSRNLFPIHQYQLGVLVKVAVVVSTCLIGPVIGGVALSAMGYSISQIALFAAEMEGLRFLSEICIQIMFVR